MTPTESRAAGSILFEANIIMKDNLDSNMMLEVDVERTNKYYANMGMDGIISQLNDGKVYLDSAETSFHFVVMMEDSKNLMTSNLFDNPDYNGYVMANRFCNQSRDLTLYKPMSMMRSVITFDGTVDNYKVKASLIPFLKYDVPLDEERMSYFIRAFTEQYRAVEPVLKRLDGNSFIDFKLFNTYGRSNNYYVGPWGDSDVLWDSNERLDDVCVRIKFKMAVYDRSIYTITMEAVINEIQKFFDSINSGDLKDVHVSDLIHAIKENHPNVHYIRFISFNDYDTIAPEENVQSIFVKFDDTIELDQKDLRDYVPEMIRVDKNTISIIEEV
jgi:hypothetical protein